MKTWIVGLIGVCALLATAPAVGQVIWEYDADASGAADPESAEGGSWGTDASADGPVVGPLTPDAPYPENAWMIDVPDTKEHAYVGVISGDM